MVDPEDQIDRLRSICLALPDATEKIAWGDPTFRIHDRIFAMAGTNADGHAQVWCKSEMELRDALIDSDPAHYFSPPYVGHKGWIGIILDEPTDWEGAANLVEESYLTIATKGAKAKGKRQKAKDDGQ
ncbi:MAG: MmcQ/YjbR family DNA-binding protein [Thermomicrobiales bacterium]|nr:MmcQ/YjbR family DNA-binding protein [Thermomicrobiales bacterium]